MRVSAVVYVILICCVVSSFAASAILIYLSNTSYDFIPQRFYGITHPTRDVAGLVMCDKTGEYYEHETRLVFENNTGFANEMDFSFRWDVVDGFDENAVVFNNPDVTYEVGDADKGWRRLTVSCKGLNVGEGLTAKLRYPANVIALRDTIPGYYKWDLDSYTNETIAELDDVMVSFGNIYACANWIKRNISYEIVTGGPKTAAETFRSGSGDCDDIAILFCYMVERLFPETEPRVVEGWTTEGAYHANVVVCTDEGWLMLDPSMPSARFGVFDFNPFVPSGRVSAPFGIATADGRVVESGGIDIGFAGGTVSNV
jgi:hypothetical protein